MHLGLGPTLCFGPPGAQDVRLRLQPADQFPGTTLAYAACPPHPHSTAGRRGRRLKVLLQLAHKLQSIQQYRLLLSRTLEALRQALRALEHERR